MLPVTVAQSRAQTDAQQKIKLFDAADESARVIGLIVKGETTVPLAETSTAGGVRWFLVRTKSGVTGWLRQGNNEQFRETEQFFRSLPKESSAPRPNVTNSASPAASEKSARSVVPIRTNGSVVIVQAVMNDTINANLILDTGASTTLISKELARQLSIYESGMQMARTVNGVVTMPSGQLESIRIGDAELKNVAVAIHDLTVGRTVDGLLGLNFLNHFEFSIDLQNRRLILISR